MVQISYRRALDWLIQNDEVTWVKENQPISTTGKLVADLFRKSTKKVRYDLQRMLEDGGDYEDNYNTDCRMSG